MAPMSIGAPPRYSSRIRCSSASRSTLGPSDWGSQPSPNRAVRRRAAGDEPPTQMGGRGLCTGRGLSPTPDAGQRGPVEHRELVDQPGGQAGDGLVGGRTPVVERRAHQVELLVDVAGPHPADDPAPGQDVEGGELLGRPQRVAEGHHVDVGEEPDVGGDPGQPAQRGDRVVPGGAHGPGQPFGDEGVVAHPDVEEAGRLAGQCHPGQFVRAGRRLPGLDVDGRLGLDGQLHPEHRASGGQDGDRVGGGGGPGWRSPAQRTSPVAVTGMASQRPAARPAGRRSRTGWPAPGPACRPGGPGPPR